MPGFRTRSGSADMAGAAEEDGDTPVSQSEIDNLRKLVGDDPVLEKKVADGLLVCGDWNSTLRRFCQFAKQMPTKQGRSRPQPQTDGLHYLAEAVRLRELVGIDSIFDRSRLNQAEGKEIASVAPFVVGGYDNTGAAVLWLECSKLNGSAIASAWDKTQRKGPKGEVLDDIHNGMVCWYLRIMEYLTLVAMPKLQAQGGVQWDRIVFVVDATGLGFSAFNGKVKRWLVANQDVGNVAYANMLKRVYVLNVPYLVKGLWNVIKPFLDPFVAAKVRIYSKAETEHAIKASISPSQLPEFLGGKLPRSEMVSDFYPDLVSEAVAARRQAASALEASLCAAQPGTGADTDGQNQDNGTQDEKPRILERRESMGDPNSGSFEPSVMQSIRSTRLHQLDKLTPVVEEMKEESISSPQTKAAVVTEQGSVAVDLKDAMPPASRTTRAIGAEQVDAAPVLENDVPMSLVEDDQVQVCCSCRLSPP